MNLAFECTLFRIRMPTEPLTSVDAAVFHTPCDSSMG
jgi:hypothetical protein